MTILSSFLLVAALVGFYGLLSLFVTVYLIAGMLRRRREQKKNPGFDAAHATPEHMWLRLAE